LFGLALPEGPAPVKSASAAGPRSFYASPSGRASGSGTSNDPWDLQTALDQPASVRPGDTIWLRGGTYSGSFTSRLNGTASASITVRQAPGERATLDGAGSSNPTLVVAGSYSTFWGFEVTNTDTNRPRVDFSRPNGVIIAQDGPHPRIQFINLIVHDAGSGFGFWAEGSDSEIYGCLIYYNGNTELDHGIYAQNQTGAKKITDNLVFHNYGHGLHAYGSGSAHLDGFDVEGNILYNNGLLSTSSRGQRNLLIGGGSVAHNLTVKDNSLYFKAGGPLTAFNLGYSAGCTNAVVADNYNAGNSAFVNCVPVSMTGNAFYGSVSGLTQSLFPANIYSGLPSGARGAIRPNRYETGRAYIAVYNWDLLDSVFVDLSGVVPMGAEYEIRHPTAFFGPPLVGGVYSGGTVALPMRAAASPPVGFSAPASAGPEFGAFVVISTSVPRATPRLVEPPPSANPQPQPRPPARRRSGAS
jgi:hypothetical protein